MLVIEGGPETWEHLVLAADYLFALFDGVNRYYVRSKDRDWLPRLAAPVRTAPMTSSCTRTPARSASCELAASLRRRRAADGLFWEARGVRLGGRRAGVPAGRVAADDERLMAWILDRGAARSEVGVLRAQLAESRADNERLTALLWEWARRPRPGCGRDLLLVTEDQPAVPTAGGGGATADHEGELPPGSALVQHLPEGRLDGVGPDPVALGAQVEEVGHDLLGRSCRRR